ncbi:UDP-2,4-diacetamido-2,4,6-trideoxy-beta-L-altropyranose hydrolase [Pseudomonas sp. AU11447]|uniref:UDP-2,4-diacetamido-2,4, 6-trideoxy-beta-L-altropyranose hydrolase n=1 Tax=unclassified Pseudomonas TaxID=196821 RepID=UPI0006D400B0|nr:MULTISPECIES: UDP-2,4-diacetamido-2,4,6-trideoxy-beta-L-altropyranose hydrolase [unclassified Pseudomonas]OBY92288.1 UDP-2,4-diacetamido-2,4,6-trideoxy-beta-L-altropyranose hydrolase [Pseudomonas sp. AU11447]
MKIVFRVDASLRIGTGHVMRCLTLADALKANGAQCHFISREHPGNLNALIQQREHTLGTLPYSPTEYSEEENAPPHASWLETSWEEDAIQTAEQLVGARADWLILDHYALDYRWEKLLAEKTRHIMVIDDLADRLHACDLLLDQNLGRSADDYARRVPAACRLLLGPQFALLRPEFAQLRDRSLQRRQKVQARSLLISMGGGDTPNATTRIMHSLRGVLDSQWTLQVVMGANALRTAEVDAVARSMPCPTSVLVNTPHMAKLMVEADIAIGAAGSTSWERCCLGLPSIMLVMADNQERIATQLQQVGAAALIQSIDSIETQLPLALQSLCAPSQLHLMALAAADVTDGKGTERVIELLTQHPGVSL